MLMPKLREYQSTFTIRNITIASFTPPEDLMGSSGHTRSNEKANEKWHIVSPTSRFNCLFQSIAVCRNFHNNRLLIEKVIDEESETDPSKIRIVSGKNLKAAIRLTGVVLNDNFADNMTIQQICDWSRYPIHLYNNVFEKIKVFTPKNPMKRYKQMTKFYEIQRCGDHCKALIPRKNVKKCYPDFDFNQVVQKEEDVSTINKAIPKKKVFHQYNHKIAAWDIETSLNARNEHVPYACSIAWFEYKFGQDIINERKKKVVRKGVTTWKTIEVRTKNITESKPVEQQFWGTNCLQNMTSFIHQNKEIFNNCTLYAHNGGKYDLPLAIKKAFIESPDFQILGKGCVELNNSWIGFTLRGKTDRDFKLHFRDSFSILPMSLAKLTRELKVKHQKLTETVTHSDITLINYNTFPQLPLYLTHDVFGLLEVVQIFGVSVFTDLGIDITKCFTGASLSKMNYFKNYYDSSKPVFKLSDENDRFIRNSYFGGRVECFQMGEIKKAYYYDFTSLYPDVGRKRLPYGKPTIVPLKNASTLPYRTVKKQIRKDHGYSKIEISTETTKVPFFGWVECRVKTKDVEAIPKHCVIQNSRLIFPIFKEWTNITVFSEEIDYDIYQYEFITGVSFKYACLKNKFFSEGFQKKAQAKADNCPAMQQAYKIIINSPDTASGGFVRGAEIQLSYVSETVTNTSNI